MDLEVINFGQVCRTCKCVTSDMRPIFEGYQNPHESPRIDEMLMACASVQVTVGDGLPSQICQICVEQLNNAFVFKRQCEKSDASLREYAKNVKVNEIKEELQNSDFMESLNTLNNLLNEQQSSSKVTPSVGIPPLVAPKIETDYIQFMDNNQMLLTCRECAKIFTTLEGLRCHKRIHTGSMYKCKQCDKEYTRLNHLQRHEQTHNRRKVHVCRICSKTLTRMEHLKRHLVTHLREKPFSCKTCNRGFNRVEHLHNHTPRCKGDTVYPCDICNKSFNREDSLEVHKKMHDNQQPKLPTIENLDNIEDHYYQIDQDASLVFSDHSDTDDYFEPQIEVTESLDEEKVKDVPDIAQDDESNVSETSAPVVADADNDNDNDNDSSVDKEINESIESGETDDKNEVKVEEMLIGNPIVDDDDDDIADVINKMYSNRTLRIHHNAESGVCEDKSIVDCPILLQDILNTASEDYTEDAQASAQYAADPLMSDENMSPKCENDPCAKSNIEIYFSDEDQNKFCVVQNNAELICNKCKAEESDTQQEGSKKNRGAQKKENSPDVSNYSAASSRCSICNVSSEFSELETANANEDGNEERKLKKRKAGPENWNKNLAKRLRNSGKSYTQSTKNKKVFPERKLLPPCDEKCKIKCFAKFTEEDRISIFNKYWSLGDLQRQRDFIATSMTTIKPKYRYVREGSNRLPNNAFHFEIHNQRIRVCKLFFKNTLSINDRPIRTVISKRDPQHPQFIANDLRGKHTNHHKLDAELKQSVRQHIESIPRIPSHYCRANTTREYLEGGLTISELHRRYKSSRVELGKPVAKYVMYNKIFNGEYNISFLAPKKDQCNLCVAFEKGTNNDKKKMKGKYEDHLKQKELSRIEKQIDKKSGDFVAMYDFQAVLPCPKGNTPAFFYISKLNVFNFTIYDIKTSAVQCYVWHEAQGSREANEIGSCILSYLRYLNNTFEDERNVIFYSDNCGGQQKNRSVLSMYLYAVRNLQKIKTITHKYLTTGHTQKEGNDAHSLIERNIRKALKSGPIYIPEQYFTLIRTAKKTGNPYGVKEMNYEDFYDLKHLANSVIGLGNFNESIKISEMQIFKVDKEYPNKIFYKRTYDQGNFESVDIEKPRRRKTESEPLLKAYRHRPGISEIKKKSLLSLFIETASKKRAVPKCYKEYYNNL